MAAPAFAADIPVTDAAGLAAAIAGAAAGDRILIQNDIVLGSTLLPPVSANITIEGSGFTIDAQRNSRIFFLNSSATIQNVTLAGGNATGGAGGNGQTGGGGGLGAGGAIFVNTGNAILSGVNFASNSATGGAGGGGASGSGTAGGGGGGGLGGSGGGGGQDAGGGGGGYSGGGGGAGGSTGGYVTYVGSGGAGPGGSGGNGGSGAPGQPGANGGGTGGTTNSSDFGGSVTWTMGGGGGGGGLNGGNGGDGSSANVNGGGGGGGGGLASGSGGTGGTEPGSPNGADGTTGGGGGGAAADGSTAGNGGDFGGGGGGTNSSSGGNGGFGGGGGSAGGSSIGGSGGFGGGGGGAPSFGTPGTGGVGGGNAGSPTAGGGAGFGGAVFVRDGASLTIADGAFTGGAVTGGVNRFGAASGAAAGTDLFLQAGTTTTLSPTGTLTFNGTIADDSASSVPTGQTFTAGSSSGAAIAVTGGTVALNGANTYSGGTTLTGGAAAAGNASAFGGGTVTFNGGALSAGVDNLILANGVAFNPTTNTIDTNGMTLTLSGVIADGSGTGAFTKSGSGTLVLSGANTYTGDTTLAAGTLRLENSAALGTGNLITTGSVVDYANGVDIANTIILQSNTTQLQVLTGTATQSGAILEDVARPVEKIGAGTLVVNAANNSGTTTISAGTWAGGGNNAFSANSAHVVAAGATLDLGGFHQTIDSLSGAGSVVNNGGLAAILQLGTAGVTTASTTFSGVIADGTRAIGVAVETSGTLTLTGANTYTGGTLICDCATLQIGNGGTTGSIMGDVINNNLLIFNRSNGYNFGGTIIDGLGSPGRVQQLGTGTLTLSGNNTYSGGTTISAGVLQANNANALGSGTITLDGGTLTPGVNGLDLSNAVAINSTDGTVDTGSNTFTLSGIIANGSGGGGTLTKSGSGTLVLSGNNTFSGGTLLNEGTLNLAHSNALGTGTLTTQGTVEIDYADAVTIGNAITANGSDTSFRVGTGSTATQSGLVTATQSIAKTGNGTLIVDDLSGVASTFVIGGTLQGGAMNAFGANNAFTVNGGSLDLGGLNQAIASLAGNNSGGVTNNGIGDATLTVGAPAGTSYFDGAMTDGNRQLSFTLDGTAGGGTLVLGGISTYSGPTSILGGTLQIDGSITSAVTVSTGGTLAGTGSVGDTVVNAGATLLPGSVGTPGTLTITGTLTFNGASNYVVFMTPTLTAMTSVSGTASLGGTVFVNAATGQAYAAGSYRILTAAGGLGGTTFDTLNVLGTFGGVVRNPHLVYNGDDVFLVLDPGTITITSSFNGNQSAVATGINNAILGGANPNSSFTTVLGYSGQQLTNALNQLSGEGATGGSTGGIQMMNTFLSLLLNPYGGAPGGNQGALGFARGFGAGEQALTPEAASAYAAVTPKDRRADNFGARWGAWGQGYGGYNSTGGDAGVGSSDLTARTWGLAAGADYRVTPNTTLGFALAGGTMNWSLSGGLGGGKSNVFQLGAYGSHSFGAAYLSAALSYAWHDMTTDRTVTAVGSEQLRADFNAHNFGGRLEGGYRFGMPQFAVTPYAALQVQQFRTPAYSEYAVSGPGAFALSYDARSTTATRVELGAWFDKLFALDGGNALAIRARAAWAHDHSDNPGMGAVFQTLPGSNFTVNGASAPDNSALLSAGAEYRLANSISIGAKFDGEFASQSQTYSGTGTVRYTW